MIGLSTQVGIQVAERTKSKQIAAIQKQPITKKDIGYFMENVYKINSVDDFINDYRIYSFVMRAFDLDDRMTQKALIKSVLCGKNGLDKKFPDGRVRELAKTMGFLNEGKVNLNVLDQKWRQAMVDRFVNEKFHEQQSERNPAVGDALYFKDKAPSITTYYQILADRKLANVFRTALNLPDSVTYLSVDAQIALYQKKFDVAKFKDPEAIGKLITRYAAITDAAGAFDQTYGSSSLVSRVGGYDGIVSVEIPATYAASRYR